MKGGDKLPSHRDLAEQIVVAPLTVKRAYDELESQGYLETRRGRGTFVCENPPRMDRKEQIERIQVEARRLLSQASLAGLKLSEVVEILKDAGSEADAARREEAKR